MGTPQTRATRALARTSRGGQAGLVDFEATADDLYRMDPEQFVPARTAAVAEARKAGDRPLAARIGALKKPTRSAWLVNLLARSEPDELAALQSLAARVARAHSGADLTALREVGAERQRLVDSLTRRAVAAANDRGYAATEAVRLEVNGTLASAVADAEVLQQVLAGRVTKAQVYSGFGFPLGGMVSGAAARQVPDDAASQPTGEPAQSVADRERDRAQLAAQQAVSAATERLLDARAALAAAQSVEQDVAQALDRVSHEVADLRTELRRAEQAEEGARRSATQAADDVHDARTAVQQAEQALTEAARALADQG